MKRNLAILLVGTMIVSTMLAGCGQNGSTESEQTTAKTGELKGDITFWHSFTQGPRLEVIQETADQFMKDNPDVNITIETFSWGDFYTKWTTGLASGNVPDMSTALPGHVVEMMDAEALVPLDDLIDDIGRDKFSKTALSEGEKDGTCYSLPLYSHAQVMWYRKDLLEAAGLQIPVTWDEFAEAAKTLTKDGVYGCSFPCGSNDLMGTRFLNFYVRSGGGSLLTEDLKADLTSDLAIDGINYWLDIYNNCSPKDSVNYAVL
ncbi:sugar ABC transporter substrate-binding protein, partial [Blautia pseudococcoides]|nr:sugar ABC transporter substrate-binding protein [Blautia pseudococcoides]